MRAAPNRAHEDLRAWAATSRRASGSGRRVVGFASRERSASQTWANLVGVPILDLAWRARNRCPCASAVQAVGTIWVECGAVAVAQSVHSTGGFAGRISGFVSVFGKVDVDAQISRLERGAHARACSTHGTGRRTVICI